MKFKIIFLLFNVLIVFSFLMIFLMPVFMLGGDYAREFLLGSWYIALIFAVILAFINIIYFTNKKVLDCLETENWPELKLLLSKRIFENNRTGRVNIRMYISTCIATSSVEDITLLEDKFRKENPAALKTWALQIGLPHLLSNNAGRMKGYFGQFLDAGTKDTGWIKWNYCFALLLLRETEEAVGILKTLADENKDPLLRMSVLYMLSPFGSDEAVGTVLSKGRTELRSTMTRDSFSKELEKRKDNVQMLFLSKIFNEALEWLFSDEAPQSK